MLGCACVCFVLAGMLARTHTLLGAGAFWALYMFCFWRFGAYLPGVPPSAQGIFRMQQVLMFLLVCLFAVLLSSMDIS